MKQYMTSLIAFILIDFVWLVWIAPRFYQAHIGHLMSPDVDLKAAIAFYLIFLAGLNLFVITPQATNTLGWVAAYGAAFGAVTYGTFDLTSVAVMKDFPYLVALVDMSWGACLSAGVSVSTVWIGRTWAT